MTNSDYLSDAFLDRVKASYQKSVELFPQTNGAVWPGIDALRRDIHSALLADSNDALRFVFIDPVRTDLFYGVDNLALSVESSIRSHENVDESFASAAFKLLRQLSYALGVESYVPPDAEQFSVYATRPYYQQPLSLADMIAGIENHIGITIDFGDVFRGDHGLTTPRGIVTLRAIAALYQAFQVVQEANILENKSVLEIGPGTGRTADYCKAMGIQNYTTIDLPLGVVAQACFIGASLGPASIRMIADPENGDAIQALPAPAISSIHERIGIALNVDSMTEMSESSASDYLLWIASHADRFISINHEANEFTVNEIAKKLNVRARFRRFPHWMRPGYCEEIFSFT